MSPWPRASHAGAEGEGEAAYVMGYCFPAPVPWRARSCVCAQENKVMLEAGPVYEALGLPPSHQFKSPGASPKVSPACIHQPLHSCVCIGS